MMVAAARVMRKNSNGQGLGEQADEPGSEPRPSARRAGPWPTHRSDQGERDVGLRALGRRVGRVPPREWVTAGHLPRLPTLQ